MTTTQATTFNNADQTSLTAAAMAAMYSLVDGSGVRAAGQFALIGSFQALYVSYGAKLREALVRRSVSSTSIPMLTDRDIDGAWGPKTAKAAMAVLQNAALGATQCPGGYMAIGQAGLFDTAAKVDANLEEKLMPAWRCLSASSVIIVGVLDFALNRVRIVQNATTQVEAIQALSTYMRSPSTAAAQPSVPTAPLSVAQVTVSASNPSSGFFSAMQAAASIPNTTPLIIAGSAVGPDAIVYEAPEEQITAQRADAGGLPTPIIVGGVIIGAFAGVWLFKRWTKRKR